MQDRSERRQGVKQASTRVVMDALRRAGPSSQATIARLTGLSRATVSTLVQRLKEDGLVDTAQVNGRETTVTLRSSFGAFIAVEVHPRSIRAALFDFVGQRRVDAESSCGIDQPTSATSVERVVRALIDGAGMDRSGVLIVAVAFDAPILRGSGTIASWAWQRLPEWKGVALAADLTERLGIETIVDNDANLAALAEWTWGAGQGCEDFLYVMSSQGVGGGLVLDGHIFHGGTGMAGEIGHMVVEEAGGLCFCGSRGCLSGFVSERAILAALAATDRPRASLQDVIDGAREDDGACQRVLFEAGRHLGKALAAVARVVAPSMVAIGGALGTAEPFVMEGISSSAEIINLRAIAPAIVFRPAAIKEEAVILGALAAALAHADQGASELASWMRLPADPVALATA